METGIARPAVVEPDETEKSLMDELDALEVIEAKALQEGIAFHAFRFKV
jgi:hypothetical protein